MPSAQETALIHGVSQRTARRHLKNGTLPAAARTTGRDGKSYPVMRRNKAVKSPNDRDISMARNAIRRLARVETIHPGDLDSFETIRREAIELWRRWRDAADAIDSNDGAATTAGGRQ